MSRALWFVIGLVIGDIAGRWLTHAIYLAIILAILAVGTPQGWLLCIK